MKPLVNNPRLPAEWDLQQSILMSWPRRDGPFSQNLRNVETCFTQIAQNICNLQHLIMLCEDVSHVANALKQLPQSNLTLLNYATDDIWTRDFGPIGTLDKMGSLTLHNFEFNGWGSKHPHQRDNNANSVLKTENLCSKWLDHNLILEGGSIESDGEGTLLTTEQCLLATSRNPTLNKIELESYLSNQFGTEKIIWLKSCHLPWDDTDGHIDTIVRFAPKNKLLYLKSLDHHDDYHSALNNLEDELSAIQNLAGKPYELYPLPMTPPIYNRDGQRLPSTYANFLVLNYNVLVPTYDCSTDIIALQVIQTCYPDRKVVGINCLPLIEQLGSLHCATMHLPAEHKIQ